MKHALPRLTTLLAAGVLLQAPLFAQDAKPAAKPAGKPAAIATVNGVAIPVARAEALLQSQLAQGQQDSEQLRVAVRNDLITREMLSQASKKKGFDKKPDVQAQFELSRHACFQQVLAPWIELPLEFADERERIVAENRRERRLDRSEDLDTVGHVKLRV